MASQSDIDERFSSRLSAKADRLVSELLARAIEHGWRDAETFLEHFSVERILEALASEEDLRVRLLVETTGTHEKIAAKKSPTSAAEDLRLALDEGTTTPDAVLALFDADDWVRLLEARPVWEFLTEDKFWTAEPAEGSTFTEAVERVTETIHCAISHKILREVDIVAAVGFERLAQRLVESQLREIVISALESGARGEPFTIATLLDVISLEAVLEQATLGRAWSDVVVKLVQEPLGLGSGAPARRAEAAPPESEPRQKRDKKPNAQKRARRAVRADASAPAHAGAAVQPARTAMEAELPPQPAPAEAHHPEPARAEPKPLTPPESARRRASTPPPAARPASMPPPAARAASMPPPPQRPASSAPPAPPQRPAHSMPPLPPSARAAARQVPSVAPSSPPPPNDPALAQAVARLGRIDRLPPRHNEFPAAVIHAIESMYGELATVSDAQAQLAIIKEAFPNDAWRSRAMLALLELLNPGALAASPEIARESADALSIRLLTEERQLSRQAAQSRHARPGAR